MKNLILVLVLLVGGIVQAAPQHAELCVLNIDDDGNRDEEYFVERGIDVIKTKSLKPLWLKLVNDYLGTNDYDGEFKGPMTLKEIQAKYEELDIRLYTSKKTGRKYLEVISWPGDNASGLVYDAKTGEYLAVNSDGSYDIVISGKEVYCGDL